MINRYKEIPIDDASAGMVLFDDVCDAKSGILLPASTVLSNDMLTSLRRRGTTTLQVFDNALSEQEWTIECDRVRSRMAYLFRHCGDNRPCLFLREQMLQYRLGSSD